nr:hypothetical protein [Tanacetum cinerariifolium]
MQFNQSSQQQQQQPNQVTASQPQSDQQSFHLVDEIEDETRRRAESDPNVEEDEQSPTCEVEVEENQRKRSTSRSQETSSNSVEPRRGVDFGGKFHSNIRRSKSRYMERTKNMLTGKWTPMNENVQKFNQIVGETLVLSGENDDDWMTRVEIFFITHGIAEDMKVLQINTRGIDPDDAAIINAQKARIRAAYPPPN